jgi:hypothetical protein
MVNHFKNILQIGEFLSYQRFINIFEDVEVTRRLVWWVYQIQNSFHGIGGCEIQHYLYGVEVCDMRRNNQFSIRPFNFDFASNDEWTKILSASIARTEFETFRKTIDKMKTAEIPNYHQHHLFKSYDESIIFTNFIVPFKPDQLITSIEIEQKLIECHDVMSISLCWCYNA